MGKKYFYLKIGADFFNDFAVKMMQKENPAFVMLYQLLLIEAAKHEGYIALSGATSAEKEISFLLNSTEKTAKKLLTFLEKTKKFSKKTKKNENTEQGEECFYFPDSLVFTDRETPKAAYMREYRKGNNVPKRNPIYSQSTDTDTDIDTDIPHEDNELFRSLAEICKAEHIKLDYSEIALFQEELKKSKGLYHGRPIESLGAVLREYEKDRSCFKR